MSYSSFGSVSIVSLLVQNSTIIPPLDTGAVLILPLESHDDTDAWRLSQVLDSKAS
jgi:hypothetical protein